ncbi:hypothetical protein VM1G_11672 [Cytospora mali]|uniref:Uncharacterized protein n=1 Tax=Cytospora mali TaxID=578113 RepID=A0A194W3Z5_CYTMA|nr:hypothetical protein VM1G_11672 [Valsa mali]
MPADDPSAPAAGLSAAPPTQPQEEAHDLLEQHTTAYAPEFLQATIPSALPRLAPRTRVGPRITYPDRLVDVVLPVVILIIRVVIIVVLVYVAPVLEQLLVAPDLPDAVPLLLRLLVGREAGVRVDACRERHVAACLDERLDLGLEFLAEELHEDIFLRAAGEVGRGVDDDALEGG